MTENQSNSTQLRLSSLDDSEKEYLAKIVKKYSAYKNRTKSQELLLTLNAIENKINADIRNIRKILKVEKTNDDNKENQKKVTAILRKDNQDKRKLIEHEKYKLGGAIHSPMLENLSLKVLGDEYPNKGFADFVQDLINAGLLYDDVVRVDSQGNEINTIIDGKKVKVKDRLPPRNTKGNNEPLFPVLNLPVKPHNAPQSTHTPFQGQGGTITPPHPQNG